MQSFVVHSGGERVTKDELDLIPVPGETDSYKPVSHYSLSDKLLTISQDLLTDYILVAENYALARNGNQLFALLNFQQKESSQSLRMAVAFRNSYDRSMSIGLAIGANVFICDNLALSGDIAVMKKHTKNVWIALEDLAISTLYKAQKNYQQILVDADKMRTRAIGDIDAFQAMGILYGKDIVSPRQLTTIKQEWLKPSFEDFRPRNLWSLYNACTYSLKSSPPSTVMEKHVRLHNTIIDV